MSLEVKVLIKHLVRHPKLADHPTLSPRLDLLHREAQLSQYDIAVLTQSGRRRGFQRSIAEAGTAKAKESITGC